MPTVSAVIATYNRCADLAVSLPKLVAQTRPPDEIVIVDDGSTDDTGALIAERFPSAIYIRLPENRGLIAARNVGMLRATGDYILSLDDDCWFLAPDGLAAALDHARKRPGAAVFSFNVVLPNGDRSVPPGTEPFETGTFFGGASLLHRKSVIDAGLYAEEFRCLGEESDLAMRLHDSGHSIVTVPNVLVYHAQSDAGRNHARIRFYSHRNAVLREILRCPPELLPAALLRTWAANTRYNLAHGYWRVDLALALRLPDLLKTAARLRRPVRREAYRTWRHLP
jgi:GT2 family glycosyltransferase